MRRCREILIIVISCAGRVSDDCIGRVGPDLGYPLAGRRSQAHQLRRMSYKMVGQRSADHVARCPDLVPPYGLQLDPTFWQGITMLAAALAAGSDEWAVAAVVAGETLTPTAKESRGRPGSPGRT